MKANKDKFYNRVTEILLEKGRHMNFRSKVKNISFYFGFVYFYIRLQRIHCFTTHLKLTSCHCLPWSRDMRIMLSGYSKLPIGVNGYYLN